MADLELIALLTARLKQLESKLPNTVAQAAEAALKSWADDNRESLQGKSADPVTVDDIRAVVMPWLTENITQPKDGNDADTINMAQVAATIKIWAGTVTSDGNGDFTVDYSSAGFTAPPMVTVSALSTNTDTVRDKEWATLRETPTTTSANGYTLRGNLIVAILIGGAETVRDAPNVVVQVHAIGV